MIDKNIKPLILSERFDNALAYGAAVHRTQMRKATSIPYMSHLMSVAAIVLENGGDEDEAIAALLHDAPEDQGGQECLNDIRAKFGDRVADIVEACSDALAENPDDKPEWHDRKARYHQHLRESRDTSVLLVSAADKLHNARTTAADLRRHGEVVWMRFKGGRDGPLWNYGELLEIYNAASDPRLNDIVSQLSALVAELST